MGGQSNSPVVWRLVTAVVVTSPSNLGPKIASAEPPRASMHAKIKGLYQGLIEDKRAVRELLKFVGLPVLFIGVAIFNSSLAPPYILLQITVT